MIKQKTKTLIQILQKTPSNEIKWQELIKYLIELEKISAILISFILFPE